MSKLDEVLKDVSKEKSDTMEERYTRNIDTWGNKDRYDDIVQNLVSKVEKYINENSVKWLDLGSGPGWVVDSLRKSARKDIVFSGYDISETAIRYGIDNNLLNSDSKVFDLNDLKFGEKAFYNFKVVSLIDVMYYLGGSGIRDWHETARAIWDNLAQGSILVVADCLVRFQYREFWKSLDGCEILEDYIEYSKPVYVTDNGNRRNLKVKIYRKM